MRLYSELTPWYRLLDPTEDHAGEAAVYVDALRGAIEGDARTLLELGTGAGNNAFYVKRAFDCTLTDLSEDMLGLSREINPECPHILGDMRSLRLGRTFDAVMCHDAVCYMVTPEDLAAAAATAWAHLRPGGAALFAPDHVADTFAPSRAHHEAVDGDRVLGCLEWTWDPDPDDACCTVDFAFLLGDGREVRAVHERHIEGLFTRADWVRTLAGAGFEVDVVGRPPEETEARYDAPIFIGRRPRR